MKHGAWGLLLLLVAVCPAESQLQSPPDSLKEVNPLSPADSARIVAPLVRVVQHDTATSYRPAKSPGLALLFSAVLPGAGQFYNESYWKVPIVLGVGYYFASRWIDNNDSTKHYRALYTNSITAESPGGNGRYLQLRDFYKDQRDTFSWYIFIYYIVNLVDAYVDASLYDFNVGPDLSIRLQPALSPAPSTPVGINLRIRF